MTDWCEESVCQRKGRAKIPMRRETPDKRWRGGAGGVISYYFFFSWSFTWVFHVNCLILNSFPLALSLSLFPTLVACCGYWTDTTLDLDTPGWKLPHHNRCFLPHLKVRQGNYGSSGRYRTPRSWGQNTYKVRYFVPQVPENSRYCTKYEGYSAFWQYLTYYQQTPWSLAGAARGIRARVNKGLEPGSGARGESASGPSKQARSQAPPPPQKHKPARAETQRGKRAKKRENAGVPGT